MAKQTIGIGSAANDGTGDTLRSAFDKANDNFTELYDASSNSSTLNVLTYGADNTGATDSLAAFDAAIAAASAGDRIYIPTGTFSLSNAWTISKQVTVFGPGTITEASVLTPVIEVTADKVQLHDFTVSGIETTGNWNTSAATIHARCGIHINDGDDCLISRVRIVTKSTGIKLTAANRTTIRDALWQGINLASQPASYAESAGLRTVSAIDVLVDGGSWTLGGRGMALEGVLTARVTIKSPTIYTCESDGIYINDPSGVQILGGWIQGVDGYGINIEDGDTLTVSNVYVRSNTSASMFLGTGTVSSLKLNQSDLASLTFSTGTYDDVDLSGSDIATLTTTSGGTLKGVKGAPKSLSTVTHGATAGAPALEFNVMAFGAAGDGSTDDASAIQAAINAAAAAGGTVYIPAGEYAIASALELKDNIRIRGDGRYRSWLLVTTASGTGITNSEAARKWYVELEDFGVRAAASVHASVGINMEHTSDFLIRNVAVLPSDVGGGTEYNNGGVTSGFDVGIRVYGDNVDGGSFRGVIDSVIVATWRHADSRGILIDGTPTGYGGNSTRIINSEIRAHTGTAVRVTDGNGVVIANNVFEDSSNIAVYLDSNSSGCYVVGNRFENDGGTYGITIVNSEHHYIAGNLFDDTGITPYQLSLGGTEAIYIEDANRWDSNFEYDGDTTPDVAGARVVRINDSSSNTITDFDNSVNGQSLLVLVKTANTTFADASTTGNFQLKDGVDYKAPVTSTILFTRFGSVWYEVARSVEGANDPRTNVSADRGDASQTLNWGTDSKFQLWATTLTVDRTAALGTTNVPEGATFRIVRTAGGAFNLNVGTGPLKALATGTWCEVTYDGSAWFLSAYGSL